MADLPSWSYWKVISITGQSGAGTDYQVKLAIGDSAGGDFHLEGHCTNFPQDIRITDNDGTTLLDHWVEDITADPIVVHVEVEDDLGSNQDIRVYYGKSGESTASNLVNTMIFADDFDDASVDTSKWTTTGSNVVESGGTLQITGANSWDADGITSDDTFDRSSQGYVMVFRVKSSAASGYKIFGYGPQPLNVGNGLYNYLDGDRWRARYDGLNGTPFIDPYAADTWYLAETVLKPSAGYIFNVNGTEYDNDSSFADNNHRISINQYSSGQTLYFDYIYVRKYNSPEPAFSSAGAEQTPTVGAIMNQFQRANIGADLYNGVFA